MEAEKELSTEKENVQRLKKKIDNLEEELYAKNLELDAINEKYADVIESRDTQIRALQVYGCHKMCSLFKFHLSIFKQRILF